MPTARRTLTLALLLVAAGSLAFATGAAVIDGDAATVPPGAPPAPPADGPHGGDACLNDAEVIPLAAPASDPTDATDVVNTIRERADSATDPATGIFDEDLGSGPLGTGGIVSPDDVPADSPLSPYELELADTDSGE